MKSFLNSELRQQYVEALATGRLSEGRILSPEQVRRITESNGAAGTLKGWFFLADVAPEMFVALRSGKPTKLHAEVKTSPSGHSIALISQQCSNWEHRLLVPLIGETALSLIEQLAEGHVGLSISTATGSDSLVCNLSLHAYSSELQTLKVSTSVRDLHALLEDIAQATLDVLEPRALPQTPTSIRYVCATLAFTAELNLMIAAAKKSSRN